MFGGNTDFRSLLCTHLPARAVTGEFVGTRFLNRVGSQQPGTMALGFLFLRLIYLGSFSPGNRVGGLSGSLGTCLSPKQSGLKQEGYELGGSSLARAT